MNRRPGQIAVIGVGGAGINAVARLSDVGLRGVRLVGVDTSVQTLDRLGGDAERVLLDRVTGGHGTGGDADLGAAAAAAERVDLVQRSAGPDVAFVVAGLAGGTGGGAGPVVAAAAAAGGAIVVGCGILPFAFEPRRAIARAAAADHRLRAACSTTVTLDNRRAQSLAGARVTFDVALRIADDVIRQAVQGLSAMLAGPAWIHVDLPRVREALLAGGDGCLALGVGRGREPACAAMRAALTSPLVDMRALGRARAVIVHVAGGADLALADTAAALELLRARVRPECRLTVGARHDPLLGGAAEVVLLGTGVPHRSERPAAVSVSGSGAVGADAGRRIAARSPAPEPLAWPFPAPRVASPVREVV